jgi:hypothetical protein
MTPPGATPTIAIALHDGFFSLGTGAGSANRAFLTALIPLLAPGVRLVILPVRLVPASAEYNAAWHARMHALIQTRTARFTPSTTAPADTSGSAASAHSGMRAPAQHGSSGTRCCPKPASS